MLRYLSKSLLLLVFSVVLLCVLYPLVLWVIGQTFFNSQANGSILLGPDGKPVGSRLIAQPFTKDEYFHPRPSAASYDASASSSSSLAPSNYALRDRVARALGPVMKYRSGTKAGESVAPDIEDWFKKDMYKGRPHIVAQWADQHNSLAQAWVTSDPTHEAYVNDWAKAHPDLVRKWSEENPSTTQPKAIDLAVMFFKNFSEINPGKFISVVTHKRADGKEQTTLQPVHEGADIQSTFCLMWLEEHPDVDLEDVPGDMVMTSASGLDPHITLQNAWYQLDRVASKWAVSLRRNPADVRKEIEQILRDNTWAPWGGLAGEKFVNTLEVNLAVHKKYGAP